VTRDAFAAHCLMCGAVAATLSFWHGMAEMLVQEPRRPDVICSIEVVEQVDSPGFLRSSFAELVKIRHGLSLPCRCCTQHHLQVSPFYFRFHLTWRTSFSVDSCGDAALSSPYDCGGREGLHIPFLSLSIPRRSSSIGNQRSDRG